MKKLILWAMGMLVLAGVPLAGAQNLIANKDFATSDPLEGYRVDFSYEGAYVENKDLVKFGELGGRPCPVATVNDKKLGMSGWKMLSPLVPIKGGKGYRASFEAYKEAQKTGMRAWAEVYAVDPRENPTMGKIQTNQIPPEPGKHPALVLCYKKDFDISKKEFKAGEWTPFEIFFTTPTKEKLVVLGKPAEPAYLCIKVMGLGAGLHEDVIHVFGFSKFYIKEN